MIESLPEWPTVWTIGHSTRTLEKFHQLLLSNAIVNLVDVRSYPGSLRYPQFNQAELAISLRSIKVNYHHLPRLGGRRKPLPDSKNTAWRNESFRAYADHMESEDFKKGIAELLSIAQQGAASIMCS